MARTWWTLLTVCLGLLMLLVDITIGVASGAEPAPVGIGAREGAA